MVFNINEFKSEIAQHGYLRPHSFAVQLTLPPVLQGLILQSTPMTNFTNNMLTLRIQEATYPMLQVQALDVHRYSMGPTQKQPFCVGLHDTWLTMICDKGGQIWNFWHQWVNTIFNFSPNYDALGTAQINMARGSYVAQYKSNYATTITLALFNQIGKPALEFVFNLAFPVEIQQVPFDWNDEGNLVVLKVALSFRDYSIIGSGFAGTSPMTQITSPDPSSVPSRAPLITV